MKRNNINLTGFYEADYLINNDAASNYKANNKSFIDNVRATFKHPFKFTIMDLAIAGLFLALYSVAYSILYYTGLSKFTGVEIIFFIFFGVLLGPFKGAFVAIIADTIGLLISGQIGTWYILYAIWPPIIAFISSIYFAFFRASTYCKIVVPFVIIIASAFIMYHVFATYVVKNDAGTININIAISKRNRDFWNSIPYVLVLSCLIIYLALMLVFAISAMIIYFVKKNLKILDYLLALGLITFVMVIYRWIFGPIILVKYYNYFFNRNYSLNDQYLVFAIPIIIKSMYNIPLYTVLFGAIYSIVIILQEKHINNRNDIHY
ncbi:ECF transporter S component [Mycoplasmopsis adleri]|uniref:ECF transporter S component n=1 Tax=Mycoplasmopsis adleri TaxID=51362 RepID=UPI003873BBE1